MDIYHRENILIFSAGIVISHMEGTIFDQEKIYIYFRAFYFIYLFIYLFMAALGLCCCVWAFSSFSERGLLFVAVRELLIAVASLVVEHRLQARGLQQLWHAGSVVVARWLQSAGSVVVAHRLSCSVVGKYLDKSLGGKVRSCEYGMEGTKKTKKGLPWWRSG